MHPRELAASAPTVLIVEDEDGVRRALERGLAHSGFRTVGVAAAADVPGVEPFDLALVDLGLPDRDGVELCTELRARHPELPIIVVTGRRDELDVVDALDAGADDYVTKPVSLAVLSARIRRHLDRTSDVIATGALRIDRRARRVTLGGHAVDLSPREFDLLTALAANAGATVSKSQLIATVWDEHWSKSTHTLSVHVSSLRAKLGRTVAGGIDIVVVPGSGYRLEVGDSNR
ncbi:MAG TPA: response regulator transcription factor [Ilumatobacteraceae bacterium]|nr:response regulator transcription factor [Ilumatobacteraceae bacterium]